MPPDRNHPPPRRISTRSRTLRVRSKTNSKIRVTELPHEVILNIITKVGFSKENIRSLRLASRTFNDLIRLHKTSIIKEIAAKQFPIASLLVRCEPPTVEWLFQLRRSDLMAEEFLTTCAKRLQPYSIHSKILTEPRYRKIALIGLHVLAAREDQAEVPSRVDKTDLPFLLDYLPDELLLCISFVGAIISQALERVVKSKPYQDRHDRFRRVSDAFLATDGWAPTWNVVVGPTTKMSERASKQLKRLREDWIRRFRQGLALVDDDDDDGEPFRPDLRMKRMVEQLVGKKWTRQKLDLAVIGALQEDRLSEEAIMDLLRGLDC
jgi:hypothetical protein